MPFITLTNKFLQLALLILLLLLKHLLMVPKLMNLTCHTILYLGYAPVRSIVLLAIPHKFFPLVSEVLLLRLLLDQTH